MTDEVVIHPYNCEWPSSFISELRLITNILPMNEIVDIQHIGSTSVPGLSAKPIIDILIGFRYFEQAQQHTAALEELNYKYLEQVSVEGGRLFLKKTPRTHHVHFVEYGTEHWSKPILFRDYLRIHRSSREAYEDMKKKNAAQYRNDRIAYMNSKTTLIQEIIIKAGMDSKGDQ